MIRQLLSLLLLRQYFQLAEPNSVSQAMIFSYSNKRADLIDIRVVDDQLPIIGFGRARARRGGRYRE